MPLEPTWAELIREAIESRLIDVHTSIPAQIVSYDPVTQTADCEICIKRAEIAESGGIIHELYPIIPNVPVGWTSGGGYSLQFTLNPGDCVWLVFSEAATGLWRTLAGTGNGVEEPGDLDRHDISYPIALPCARHDMQVLPVATGALLTVPGGGTFSVSSGEASVFVPRDDKLQAELTRIKNDIASLKSAVSSGLNAVGVGSAASGTAGAEAFDLAAATIPSNPGSTASATLKAQ